MQITCPHCQFSRDVDPAKVPDRPVKVSCPQCQQGFTFDKTSVMSAPEATAPMAEPTGMSRMVCPACGLEQEQSEACSGCGVIYAKWQQRQQPEPTVAERPEPQTGEAGNQALTQLRQDAAPLTAQTRPKAGFWLRVVASFIDSFLVGIVNLIFGFALGFAAGMTGNLSPEGQAAISLVTSLFGTALSLAYYIFFTGYCGQTPGKMALRIKVIRTDGAEISYGRAFLREVIGKFASAIILGIGYLMVAFDSQKQGLHDKIADTYVIKL